MECFRCGYSWDVSKADMEADEYASPEERRESKLELVCPWCAIGYWVWDVKRGWIAWDISSDKELSPAEVEQCRKVGEKSAWSLWGEKGKQ
jgi:hypothetical protein